MPEGTPRRLTLAVPVLALVAPLSAQTRPDLQAPEAKPLGLQQLSMEELLNVKLTVASRTETTMAEAPSVVSVITAEDIRRMGARDLRDVLRSVPGFELGVRGQLGYTEFGLRGVITDNTEKIRILLDGVPVNENLEGSGTIIFGAMALDNVQQIEIIRGPGSALYGTNAFVGVISIITKDASSSGASTTISTKGGSFNTKEGSVLTGWSGPRFRVSAYLHYLETDGPDSPIAADSLNSVDSFPSYSSLNAGISLAGTPKGHTYEFRRQLSTQLKLDYRGLTFNGVFTNIHKGPYLGTYLAVNEHSDAHPSQAQGTLATTFRPSEDWIIEPKIYALRYTADNLWNDAPEGFRLRLDQPSGPPVILDYTEGSYQLNRATQATRGAEVKATWNASPTQKVMLGSSVEEEKLYRIENFANVPGLGPDDMVESPPIMRKAPVRTLFSAFLQDQWNPTPALGITAGLRLDRYNDAGTALTPRLAAVWRPRQAFHLKAMYGEAFRAPTFVESYLYAGGGFIRGREDIQPERIKTGEFEAGLRLGDSILWRVVLFENRITNLIKLGATPSGLEYQNTPDVTVIRGIETEWTATFTDSLGGYLNLSGQSGRNEVTGDRPVGMAHWRGNLGINAALLEGLNLNATLHVVGRRERAKGDPRPDLKGYQVLDLALTYAAARNLDFSLTAHNLLDRDQRYASVSTPLPGDFPAGGRALQAGLRWRF
ncbi:MAG: TonB-dependent receptor [Acidobacteria bacterium]|nr:TonB-dependent receptor [Acidobacteriota bacterium]